MGLTPPTPGLRALFHNSIQPAKVQLAVPAGDTMIVSDEVATQLQSASTHFEDVAAPADDDSAEEVLEVASAEREPAADPGRYSERGSAPKSPRKPKA